ncbi:YeaH/YhbH family protein [Limimaricola pyoseonensis]|uniref:UPF0229 protein SAMN04488567_3709 n=1 Tax=Limimaricola pyoseonensis TaxID=521013 RepID=A0A1G7JGC2_9RHOB|nr:YeaH/YhbH family protein [Limimaricola pyoseonensis]SDF23834.1 hypothetical protein SAMN04488567_3709 [Limimaricola pyoseonensis]
MSHFIDRRLNPKGRNLGNRRRFIGRVKQHVKEAVDASVRRRAIADIEGGDKVAVPRDSLLEPSFRHASEGGKREGVLPGNRAYRAGDEIPKPPAGAGGAGRQGAPDGEGEDDFVFAISRDEFLDIFFEDLELPDLVKRTLEGAAVQKNRRAGISVTGSPSNLDLSRTMRNALGRRIALKRPRDADVEALRARLFELEMRHAPDEADRAERRRIEAELAEALRRQKRVPYLDPLDVRYRHFEPHPEPRARAVMFCLMDVSASMGAREKDLAKRFFVLLHLFLTRRYDTVDLVFIRHTHQASEVDEDTFFHARETGGTVVSTALVEMLKVVEDRYPPSEWNIYAAQASDGDNYQGDSLRCAELLDGAIMKLCQYFAYVEIIGEAEAQILRDQTRGTELWMGYRGVANRWPNFAMRRIAAPGEIYPVFRDLFSRREKEAQDG